MTSLIGEKRAAGGSPRVSSVSDSFVKMMAFLLLNLPQNNKADGALSWLPHLIPAFNLLLFGFRRKRFFKTPDRS
jgi:hypothetical protein